MLNKQGGLISTRELTSDHVGVLHAWLAAIRPRSLPIAIGPVLVGASCAYLRAGQIDMLLALLALAAALMMQVLTNLQNDVGYTVRGGDRTGTRIGFPRATAKGWLRVHQVRIAIIVLSTVAAGAGVGLVAYRGWGVLIIGSISLLAALAYMGGPKPIAYTPFGELTVFVFFGLVAVCGTDWLLTGNVGMTTVLAAASVGCLAAAALAVNNYRDVDHDREVGRQTFAATFGARASGMLFESLLLMPFCLLPAMWLTTSYFELMLPAVLLPAALQLRHDFKACANGTGYNRILFRTFLLSLLYSALLSVGALVAGFH